MLSVVDEEAGGGDGASNHVVWLREDERVARRGVVAAEGSGEIGG